jgi:hypothetical protein
MTLSHGGEVHIGFASAPCARSFLPNKQCGGHTIQEDSNENTAQVGSVDDPGAGQPRLY